MSQSAKSAMSSICRGLYELPDRPAPILNWRWESVYAKAFDPLQPYLLIARIGPSYDDEKPDQRVLTFGATVVYGEFDELKDRAERLYRQLLKGAALRLQQVQPEGVRSSADKQAAAIRAFAEALATVNDSTLLHLIARAVRLGVTSTIACWEASPGALHDSDAAADAWQCVMNYIYR
ncbi:MAG: hypothetical protein E1N59_2859 [Puniceicoccaceae bacterium 5H]|nr:MAG: hypothetical protein E1N59_2859 [Puniceicoccaceae bacterium 5H]